MTILYHDDIFPNFLLLFLSISKTKSDDFLLQINIAHHLYRIVIRTKENYFQMQLGIEVHFFHLCSNHIYSFNDNFILRQKIGHINLESIFHLVESFHKNIKNHSSLDFSKQLICISVGKFRI